MEVGEVIILSRRVREMEHRRGGCMGFRLSIEFGITEEVLVFVLDVGNLRWLMRDLKKEKLTELKIAIT